MHNKDSKYIGLFSNLHKNPNWLDAEEVCKYCKKWAKTRRPCTAIPLGECDCPKCQGLCGCEE